MKQPDWRPVALALTLSVLLLLALYTTSFAKEPWQSNMSWDKQVYTVDETEPHSILAMLEYINQGAAVAVPIEQLMEMKDGIKVESDALTKLREICGAFPPAGLLVHKSTGAVQSICAYSIPEHQMRNGIIQSIMKDLNWRYQGKVESRHIFLQIRV